MNPPRRAGAGAMSTLRERIERLVAKWREEHETAKKSKGKWKFDLDRTYGKSQAADELAAALAAEGQGDAWLDPKSLGIPLQHEPSAAAPSLHKERPLVMNYDFVNDVAWVEGRRYVADRSSVTAALHKEGAGGHDCWFRDALITIIAVSSGETQVAPDDTAGMEWIDKFDRAALKQGDKICGTATSVTTSTNEAGHRTAMDVSPSEELLSRPHRIASYSNQEELSAILNAPEPNVEVQPDGSCKLAAETERAPALSLQRTLPDEQFKGAVVERIERAQKEADYPDRLRMLMIEHRYIRDGGYSGCRCAKIQFGGQSWDADWLLWLRHIDSILAASPAGRVEQEQK